MLSALTPCRAAATVCTSLLTQVAPTGALIAANALKSLASPYGTTAAAAAATAWHRRFDAVAPGSVLRVDFPDTPVDLKLQVGEHEAVEVSSSAAAGGLVAQHAAHDGHPGSSLISIRTAAAAAADGQHSRQQQQQQQRPMQLHVRGPSRFFNLEATTAGGSVAVEVIQEGSLRLTTRGGDISVPKVKAVDAHLHSGGGAIAGAVTGVDVRLHSGGGPVRLKSLVGKRAEVDSGGGAVALGACYADHLEVQSGGGPIHVTNMDCRNGTAALRSSGGGVQVDSLDGNLSIDSGGGNVQLQLHDNAGAVSVASGGGDIHLFLSPSVAGRLALRNCARVAARSGTMRAATPQEDGLLLLLPLGGPAGVPAGGTGPLSRLQRAGYPAGQPEAQPPPPPGNAVNAAHRVGSVAGADIVLDAGGTGTVSLTERTWMDALRQRYA